MDDEDFFSLLLKVQGGRMEEQRTELPCMLQTWDTEIIMRMTITMPNVGTISFGCVSLGFFFWIFVVVVGFLKGLSILFSTVPICVETLKFSCINANIWAVDFFCDWGTLLVSLDQLKRFIFLLNYIFRYNIYIYFLCVLFCMSEISAWLQCTEGGSSLICPASCGRHRPHREGVEESRTPAGAVLHCQSIFFVSFLPCWFIVFVHNVYKKGLIPAVFLLQACFTSIFSSWPVTRG